MKKFGKYEKMRKNAILQTYITSLLCLVLCVTMFFGTSMAWFSDTAESTQNQMYVGTLEVELKHASFKDGELGQYALIEKVADEDNPIIDANIKWEPGYTAVEKFELIEKGDLAFSYQMGIECEFVDTKDTEGKVTTSADAKKAIASAITVWNYVGPKAATTDKLPANFIDLTALDEDSDGNSDWVEVGTLLEVIEGHKAVFFGEMDKTTVNAEADVKAYHMIALHMDEAFSDSAVQGKVLDGITIKLVATQKSSEQDAFSNSYDALPYKTVKVSNVSETAAAFDMNADVAAYLPASETTVGQIDLHGTGKSTSSFAMVGNGTTFSSDLKITSHPNLSLTDDAVLTIDGITVNGTLEVLAYYKNIVIKNVKAKSITVNDYANVIIEDCQLDEASNNGIYIVGTADGYNVTLRNNVIKKAQKNAVQISGCATGATYGAGKIVVEGNTFENWCQVNDKPRAAFKIWGDSVYAPEDITESKAINDAAKNLMEAIASDAAKNQFIGSGANMVKFDVYGYTFN